tara:strand:+ start:3915 stop:4301 length:387 start_codon:yes stop_codon:yes gene_type:complete
MTKRESIERVIETLVLDLDSEPEVKERALEALRNLPERMLVNLVLLDTGHEADVLTEDLSELVGGVESNPKAVSTLGDRILQDLFPSGEEMARDPLGKGLRVPEVRRYVVNMLGVRVGVAYVALRDRS